LHAPWVKGAQAVFMCCWSYTCSRNTETCRKSSRASSRAMRYHLKNVCLFLHLLRCPVRCNMSTGKRTTFTLCVEHLGERSTIRNSAHTKPSSLFFNSSSGTTITEAAKVQHISIFGICEDVRYCAQRSYNRTINIHNGQLTLHTDLHASCSGAVPGEGRTICLGNRNRTHRHIHFLLSLTVTMTYQNIDLSSWETLYSWPRTLIHRGVAAGGGGGGVAQGGRGQGPAG
jgi:hypothetical protein